MSDIAHGDGIDRTIFSSIPEAIDDIRQGRMVLVVDDADRENEGDFIMAAEACTPDDVNFMVTHGRGIVCLPCAAWRLDELGIPQMVTDTTDGHEAAFTVSIDFRHGTTTGTSAHDRAITAKAVTASDVVPRDFQKPGHVFPLRAKDGGVLRRAGHTEAAVDLATMAGMFPAGVICEVMNEDGTMARMPELIRVAPRARHEADLDRRHDRVPAPSRGAGAAGGRGRDPDAARRVPILRLREPGRRPHPRRARDGRHRRRSRGAHPGALGVPHRRRLRVAPVRLRRPAGTGDAAHRRGRARGRALRPGARGPRDRTLAQAAGVRAAGPGPRHGRGEPRARVPRPTSATTASGRRSSWISA